MASQPHPIHPLQQRLAALRREARRLTTVQGLAVVIASLLAVVIVLGGIDYLVRFQDRGVLAIFSLAALATLIFTTYRYLYLPARSSWSDTALALRVQQQLPVLNDRLASAVEFLRQSEEDPLAGSADLRRAVISQTAAACEQIDFRQVLDTRPMRMWSVVAALVATLAVVLVVVNPTASAIAMKRLAVPLGSVVWPRMSHLSLRQPIVPIGRGQAFVAEVVDGRGERLPDEVKIWYRPLATSGKTGEDVERMTLVGGVATARREQVSQSFQFRIEGGDSEPIDWTTVPVLDPPEITLLKIHRDAPAYARLAASDDDSSVSLTVLAGTKLTLSATASKPIVAASLAREGQPELPVALIDAASDRQASSLLRVAFTADRSTTFAFQLLDADKLRGGNGQRWELHVVADAPPSVVIDQPSSNLSVTSSAVVPVQVTAADDLALQSVVLATSASVAGKSAENKQVLFSAASGDAINHKNAGVNQGDQRTLTTRYDIAQLAGHVEAGGQIKLIATATDFLPQSSSSEPRTLTIISKDELLERMTARQNLLVAELVRVLNLQREAHEQVRLEQIRLHETGALEQAEVDRLQVCELNERDVARSLSRKGDGATAHVVALLAELEMNRIDNPEFTKRLQDMLDELDRLDRDHLPPLAQALTAAVKSAQVALDPDTAGVHDRRTETSLATALGQQQALIDSLEAMLNRLRQWDDYQRFQRDISRLARDQEELGKSTVTLGRKTLTKELKDLAPTESAELKVLAERQSELARQLDRLEEEMGRTSDTLRPRDAKAADALSDAQAESRQAAIANAMRHASEELVANHIGHVTEEQTTVGEQLRSLLDILGNSDGNSLARQVKRLTDAKREIGLLRKDQHNFRQGIEATGREGDPSQRQAGLEKAKRDQDKLRATAEDLARRLKRLTADDAASKTGEAVGHMKNSGAEAEKGNAERAAEHAKAAEKALEQADQNVQQALAQARTELLFEKLARLEDTVKHLHAQEMRVLDETREFDGLRRHGPLTAAQMSDLNDLAQLQSDIHDEVGRAIASTEPESVFRLALSGAADDVARAATALAQSETGAAAQASEQNAIDRLAQILEALKPEEQEKKPGGKSGDAPQKNPPPSDQVATLSELKLLKSLQEELNRRTKVLDEASAGKKIANDDLQAQFDRLSDEQGRLAALALKFMTLQTPGPAPNDNAAPPDDPNGGEKP